MIYLIGGPPKCGKTTLAKKLSKSLGISWVSTDTLENVIKPYLNKKDLLKKFPSSALRSKSNDEKYSKYSASEIISAYQKQAKTVYQAIDMFVLCEMKDGNSVIIEGYHIEPALVKELQKKYGTKNIRGIFLVKTDTKKFISNIEKSSTPNDWIIARTHKKETFLKIAEMISKYGAFFTQEAKRLKFMILNMDDNFDEKIMEAIVYLKHD
jgi:2-phosphoglycerate kinase